MKSVSVFILSSFLFVPLTSFGGEGVADELKLINRELSGKTLVRSKLIPANFEEVASADGDLNGDSLSDHAVIIHRTLDRATEKDGVAEPTQFVLIFTGEKGGKFKLWKVGKTHFVDAAPNLMEENGLGEFRIDKNVLSIGTSIAVSIGGWTAGGCTQKWRKEKDDLRLIGLTQSYMQRNCEDCDDDVDYNLVTGKKVINKGAGVGEGGKPVNKTIKGKPETVLWDQFSYDKYCSN